MNFRDRLKLFVEGISKEEKIKPQTLALGGDPRKALFGGEGDEKENLLKYENAYKLDGVVYEAINNIALSTIASGYDIKAGTPEAQENLELWDKKINLSHFMMSDVRDSLIYGPSFKEKIHNLRMEIVDLVMVNPRTMKIINDEYNTVIYYEQNVGEMGENPRKLESKYITHFGINRISGTQKYISAIGANYDMIMRMVRADEGISYAIQRHGFPKYHIKVGQEGQYISKAKLKEVKKEFEDITTKNEFVTSRDVDIGNIDTKSLEIKDLSDYFITKVTAGLGIPEERLGLGRGSTEATAKVRETAFEQKIKAIQRTLAKNYELEVFKPRLESFGIYDVPVELVFRDISPVDDKARAETLKFILSSTPADPQYILTRNEARAILHLPPLEEDEDVLE